MAKKIGVYHQQLKQALESGNQAKVTQAKRAARKVQDTVQEAIQPPDEITGTVTDNLPTIPRKLRDLGDCSIEDTLKKCARTKQFYKRLPKNSARSPYIPL